MTQKIRLTSGTDRVQTGSIQFFDKIGQLDNPGLYLDKEEATSIANAIEALESHLKQEPNHMNTTIYAVYFNRLLAIKELIRQEVK